MIRDLTIRGSVIGDDSTCTYTAGLVGYTANAVTIRNCKNLCSVVGGTAAAGLNGNTSNFVQVTLANGNTYPELSSLHEHSDDDEKIVDLGNGKHGYSCGNGTPAAHTFASVSTVKCSGCDYSRTKLTLETLDIVNGELTYTFSESSVGIEITATLTAAADLTSVTVSSINLAGDNDKTFALDTSGVSMTIPLTADNLAKATVVAYGKTVETVPFIKGWLVTLTAPAAKEGYEFDGWELDGTIVSTNSICPFFGKTADFTITAVFGKVATGDNTPTVNNKLLAIAVALNSHRKYTVSFKSVGSRLYDVQTLKRGETVILPEAPAKEGYTFAGWYRDINGIKPFDTDSKITKSITLYAKWVKN